MAVAVEEKTSTEGAYSIYDSNEYISIRFFH